MKYIAKIMSGLAVCMLLAGCADRSDDICLFLETDETEGTQTVTKEAETGAPKPVAQPDLMVIYVCGEVNVPGVYVVPEGSRICDALEAAGGMTDDASPDYWNLARLLKDGEMLYFPTREEAQGRQPASEDVVSAEEMSASSDGKVNINTATLDELMTLPGVGETRGRAILAYRMEHGVFSDKEELMQVSGIGAAIFENMKEAITID